MIRCMPVSSGRFKKVIQQGRSQFQARSVRPVREHRKLARTPLGAFFNRPIIDLLFEAIGLFEPGHAVFSIIPLLPSKSGTGEPHSSSGEVSEWAHRMFFEGP